VDPDAHQWGAFVTADYDEKTRVTQVVQQSPNDDAPSNDCLVVIYTAEPGLLGKRFVLDKSPTRVGRGADSQIVLEGDSVSRRHAHLERRAGAWYVVDDGSTNGTYVNEEQISREQLLVNGDRIKVGPSILKFLSGADAEAKYHEEIYRMTIVDGLTQIHNKRALFEALEKELMRARRYERDLSLLMFDIDFFKRINDQYGHLAGDHVLRELARIVQERIRREEVFARYGGEEFVILLPETPLPGAAALAESLRARVANHGFVFQGERIPVTVSIGTALMGENDKVAADLIQRADEKLYEAKRGGRNRVCS
jgi:two-component system, cell cycle response regulator